MPTVDPDVRAAATDVLAYAIRDARVAARARYEAEVRGLAVDADGDTHNLTMASGRMAAILELVGAAYGADELGRVYAAAERVADRRDPENAAYASRSPQEVTP